MVRHTEPDVEVEEWSTDRLLSYIGEVGPIAADLPEGEYAQPILNANVEAAVAELKARRGIETDGGEDRDHLTGDDREPSEAEVDFGETVDEFEDAVAEAVTDGGKSKIDAVVDDEHGDADHYLRHVTDDDYDHKIRHTGTIRTEVEDGYVVHRITEDYDDDADGESLRWSMVPKCPIHGNEDRTKEYDQAGDLRLLRWSCDGDDGACPFEATQAEPRGHHEDDYPEGVKYGEPDYERPLWFRVTEPHDFEGDEENFDASKFEEWAEESDDVEDLANALRTMKVRNKGMVADAAYVRAEYDGDGPIDGDKIADAYVDTFECDRCGAEHDVGAEKSHPAHDDPVCRACEDDPVWSVDDADLPDDVEALFDEYASVTPSKVVGYLRDVRYWGRYKAAAIEHADDPSGMFTVDTTPDEVDPEDVPPCPTGKQGERRVDGMGKPGTGFRRPDGPAHGDSNWRVVLREVAAADLIERVDDEDEDFDHPKARWETTDKGDAVFDELSRCEWCGARKTGHLWKHTYKVSRYNTSTDYDLITRCPDGCRDTRNGKVVDLSG